MTKQTHIQYSFTAGVLDPAVVARADLEAYYQGALNLENVLPLPFGGVGVRMGTKMLADISTMTNVEQCTLISFVSALDKQFLVILHDASATIFDENGVLQSTLKAPDNTFDTKKTAWVQTLDTLILTRPNSKPTRIMCLQNGKQWKWEELPLKIDQYPMVVKNTETGSPATPEALSGRVGVKGAFTGISVGDYFRGGGGFGRIVRVSDSKLTMDMIDAFDSKKEFKIWTIERPAWSSSHGYPIAVCLFQGRLFFGGTHSQPDTIWASKSGDYYNFSATAKGLPDDGLSATLDANITVKVQHIFGTDRIYVFTTGGIFTSIMAGNNGGLKPSNFVFPRSNDTRISNSPVCELDGGIIFVKSNDTKSSRGSNGGIYEIAGNEKGGFSVVNLATLAGRNIAHPKSMAVDTQGVDGSTLLWTVLADGKMGVFYSNRNQQVSSWTTVATKGQFLQVASGRGGVYHIVKRSIGSKDAYFIEKQSQSYQLDCSVGKTEVSATATLGGLNHLVGEKVRVIGNGADMGEHTVGASGSVAVGSPVTTWQAGFTFDWLVKTMPVVVVGRNGEQSANKVRLISVSAQIEGAKVLHVNDEVQTFSTFDSQRYDEGVKPFTGRAITYHSARLESSVHVKVFGKGTEPLKLFSLSAEVSRGTK